MEVCDPVRILYVSEEFESDEIAGSLQGLGDTEVDSVGYCKDAEEMCENNNYDLAVAGPLETRERQELASEMVDDYRLPSVLWGGEDDDIYESILDRPGVFFVPKESGKENYPELSCAVSRAAEYKSLLEENEDCKNLARDAFSSVDHDIRSPVNMAQEYINILEEQLDEVPPPLDEMDPIKQLDRAIEIVEDAREYARGAYVEEDDMKRVDIERIADEAWSHLETGDSIEANPELHVGDVGSVRADDSKLKTVFENLFRNSIDHGGRKDLEVEVCELDSMSTVTREPLDPRGIYVADNGEGFPGRDVDIFEQGETTGENNTGWGLPIVKRAVEAHDWEIATTKSENGGARVEIYFR